MVNLDLEDLPNELLLKILSYLNINSIISCGLLSKRIRFISHDVSLWQKINIYQKTVPTKFLKFVMKNGCKYLSLSCAKLKENSTLQRKSEIRFLKVEYKQMSKLYIPSTLNTEYLLRHTQLIVCAVKY